MRELYSKISEKINSIMIDNTTIVCPDNGFVIKLIEFKKENNDRNLLNILKKEYNDNNMRVLFIFQNELNNLKLLYEKISYILNFNEVLKRIHTRDCEIKMIHGTIKNLFLNDNHIQGGDTSMYSIGAFYEDELVALMTFDNKRVMNGGNQETTTFELKRFSVKNGYVVPSIANRLMKFFINNFTVNKIISFADRRWTLNEEENLYTKLGFSITNTIPSDYFYYDENFKKYHKFNYGKGNIKKKHPEIYDESLTEKELTEKMGLNRIFDLGKIKYEYNIDKNLVRKKIDQFIIYKITRRASNIPDKVYIGQTTRPLSDRYNEYKRGRKTNNHLKNAFNKYGFENFYFEVLEICSSLEELNEREIYHIKQYDSTNRDKGYNIDLGGRNKIVSEETRRKQSEARKGKKQSKEHIEKRKRFGADHHCYGKKHSEEYKQDLSNKLSGENGYWYGKKRDLSNMKQTKIEKYGKKVCQYNRITNEIIRIFNSVGEAIRETGVTHPTITRHCTGKVKQYTSDISWKYYEE